MLVSYGELLLSELKPDDPSRGDIEEIRQAGLRGVELTKLLASCGPHQAQEPRAVDLNELLASMTKLLPRLVNSNIEIVSVPGHAVGKVRGDPGILRHVVICLVENAREAMASGGVLTLDSE